MSAKARWQSVQKALGTTEDGVPGKNDQHAYEDLRDAALGEHRAGAALPNPVTSNSNPVDARSEENIATLLPEVQPIARNLVHAARERGIIIKVISGTRTYSEQDELFAKGRTKPGPRVTNARGGYSNHNFGIAFDIGVFNDGEYIPESPQYKVVAILGKSLGLSWGGDWHNIVDEPHYEYNPKGYTLAELRERKDAGKALV